MENKIITPEEFKKRMQDLKDRFCEDNDIAHSEMDDLLEKTLISLGYEEGIKIFQEQGKWYS